MAHAPQDAALSGAPHTADAGNSTTEELEGYEFPTHRLKKCLSDSGRTPLVLVACGSFSPITYLHLRIFEMALDWCRYNSEFEVVGTEPIQHLGHGKR